jgi:hypothetical protein
VGFDQPYERTSVIGLLVCLLSCSLRICVYALMSPKGRKRTLSFRGILTTSMKQRFHVVWEWIKAHRTRTLAIGGAVLVVLGAGVAYGVYRATEPEPFVAQKINVKPRPKVYYSPLTGDKVKNEAATKQLVTAIMIENSPDARPHSGLKQSGVIFEAIAEGGITRYIVLYQEDKPGLVGPVRSLRPYYLEWAAPFNPSIAHIGGSAKALREVRNGTYRDIDQFFNPQAYWRATDRYAPHNVYTNFKLLDALNKSKGFKESKFTAWERVDGKPQATPDATKITINFSSALYNTEYRYNKKSNNYTRFLGGVPHKDREKGNITPNVVIAMQVDERTVQEDGARQSIVTTGSGKAFIFQNGTVIEGKWRKAGTKKQIQWLTSDGKPIELVRGQTWIAAVPNGQGSVSW